jgi:hypothetical protein
MKVKIKQIKKVYHSRLQVLSQSSQNLNNKKKIIKLITKTTKTKKLQ